MTNAPNSPTHTGRPARSPLADGSGPVALATTIVRQVAAEKDVPPSELTPLYEVINPDALNELFGSPCTTTAQANGCVVFDYCDYQVMVTSTGDVRTTPRGDL